MEDWSVDEIYASFMDSDSSLMIFEDYNYLMNI